MYSCLLVNSTKYIINEVDVGIMVCCPVDKNIRVSMYSM